MYNLRNCKEILLPNAETNKHGTDMVAYKAAQLWNTLPARCKNFLLFDLFEYEIINWHCSDCHCSICWIFVDGLDF